MKNLPHVLRAAALITILLMTEQVAADFASSSMMDEQSAVSRIAALQNVISSTELNKGSYSNALYAPIRELGLMQQSIGDHGAAVDSFRRMQHLVHRTYGVYDPRQLESLDYILDSYYQQANVIGIDEQEHFRFRVVDRSFPEDSEEHRGSRMQLANWYRSSGRLEKASHLYSELLATTKDDPDLKLRLLRAQALTRYLAGRCCASEPLFQALQLLETDHSQHIETTQAIVDYMDMAMIERTRVQVTRSDLAPAFLGFRKSRHVLELMSTSTMNSPFGETYVDFGVREKGSPPVATIGSPVAMCGTTYKTLASGKTTPEFDVSVEIDDAGRPRNISVEGDGPVKLKRYLRDSLKSGQYRPATSADGEFVAATLSFRQTFGAGSSAPGSLSSVPDWGRMLVSQTCQVSGIQRI